MVILSIAIPVYAGGTDYVLMALQVTDGGENTDYYHLVNGAQTYDVVESKAIILASSGAWNMVLFSIDSLKPESWSKLKAAEWLSNADGFLAFDFRMLEEYARAGITIQNRSFDYNAVLDIVLRYEWWTESDGVYTKHVGTKAEYIANGYPSKLVRVLPMPHFLGNPADTY